ncbi:MAG: 3-hydroxyacyl-CoA dehydrogenase family protein, partial [Anaerolineae bacterium]
MHKIAVIGAGTMGQGIAQAGALAGYAVVLFDVANEVLSTAVTRITTSIDKGVARGKTTTAVAQHAKSALTTTTDLAAAAQADLVIEAAPEKLDLKRQIFAELDEAAPAPTILASNTSSLSINALAGACGRPAQVIGLHFFNPAHIMKLVEVIPNEFTSD